MRVCAVVISRMISEGIQFHYSTSRVPINRPEQIAQTLSVASDQGLRCLPLTQQFYTYSKVVK